MEWLRQQTLAALADGKRVLMLRADGNYLDIQMGIAITDTARLLSQRSTCPCPVCGSTTGTGTVLGPYGESEPACFYCSGDEPFVTTPETIIMASFADYAWYERRLITSALGVPYRLIGKDCLRDAGMLQATLDAWAPQPKRKTLSDQQLIESRRRYLVTNNDKEPKP